MTNKSEINGNNNHNYNAPKNRGSIFSKKNDVEKNVHINPINNMRE